MLASLPSLIAARYPQLLQNVSCINSNGTLASIAEKRLMNETKNTMFQALETLVADRQRGL